MRAKRSLEECLTLVLESYKKTECERTSLIFLCNFIEGITKLNPKILTEKEGIMVKFYMLENRPTKRKYLDFYQHPSYIRYSSTVGAWWLYYEKAERIRFLEKLIIRIREKNARRRLYRKSKKVK